METNALDYAFAAILSIVNEENEVHLVAFHSYTFTMAELNYNIYNKELLAIFEAFKIWWHYLEGPAYPINVIINHKNLKYFSTTKVLIQRQAQWSKYLSQFNFIIRFCSSHLDTKLDTLTRQWDIYPKEGILAISQSTLTTLNQFSLNKNLQPLYKLLSFSSLLFV